MPHDKNNQVIEGGDGIRFAAWDGKHRVGVVKSVSTSSTTCNVAVAVPELGGCELHTVNADMCEVLTKKDGTLVAWVNTATPAEEAATVPGD